MLVPFSSATVGQLIYYYIERLGNPVKVKEEGERTVFRPLNRGAWV